MTADQRSERIYELALEGALNALRRGFDDVPLSSDPEDFQADCEDAVRDAAHATIRAAGWNPADFWDEIYDALSEAWELDGEAWSYAHDGSGGLDGIDAVRMMSAKALAPRFPWRLHAGRIRVPKRTAPRRRGAGRPARRRTSRTSRGDPDSDSDPEPSSSPVIPSGVAG